MEKNSITVALEVYGSDAQHARRALQANPEDPAAADALREALDNIERLNLTLAAIEQTRLVADIARAKAVK